MRTPMVQLFVVILAALIFAIIVGALIIFPLLQIKGFKVFRRRF
jgi:hypothetical protein